MLLIRAVCFFPSEGNWPTDALERAAVGIGAAILLPSLSLVGVLAHNAAALFMPGWVNLGKDTQQGIEAMGQRLISLLAVTAIMGVAALPAAIAFVLVFLPGRWLMGSGAIPLAAFGASTTLIGEAAILVAWLGRMFENLDPSLEMLDVRS
jgi:hypothetical protein